MVRWHRLFTPVVVVALATGCIGATDRAEFDAEVQRRGGGVTAEWIVTGFELVAAEVGSVSVDDLEVMTAAVNTSSRTVTANARRADAADFVDTVFVREGEVVSVSPIQDADQFPLDDITFRLGDVALDEIESITDTALQEFGEPDGFVSTITIAATDGEPTISLALSSPRRTARVVFDADGTFIEIRR